MNEQKPHRFRPPLPVESGRASPSPSSARVGAEQPGWDAYRKWLSRVATKPAPERAPLDPSIYSWRGYHTWADKVRQNWKA